MKKYVTGMLAIVLALGMSAFTTDSKVKSVKADANNYWYKFDPSTGNISQIAGVPPGNEFMSNTQASSITGCLVPPDNFLCAKAYASAQTGLPKTAPAGSVDQLYKH